MIEPRDSGNPCVVVGDYGDAVGNFREADLLAAVGKLPRGDWLGATWPPTLVHREWWFKLGGYSTELSPGMSSDNDFSMKLWHAGCRHFIGVGDSLVYHFQCKSTGKVVKNDGRGQFLHKWGITQSTFDRFYLRRGRPASQADERLAEPAFVERTRSGRCAKSRWRLRGAKAGPLRLIGDQAGGAARACNTASSFSSICRCKASTSAGSKWACCSRSSRRPNSILDRRQLHQARRPA